MKTPFDEADKALKSLFKSVEREFHNYALSLAGFDQLNVLTVRGLTDEMYARLHREVLDKYLQILKKRYKEALEESRGDTSKEVTVEDLMAILQDFNKTVKYQFENEWERKKDRLIESVMASESEGSQAVRESIHTSQGYLEGQIRFFADIVTDEASMKAMRDSMVLEVAWFTMEDERVCPRCGARHEKVYSLAEAPTLPAHPRCRCWYVPIFL